jgi:iron complex outermembrane receptor protein
MSKSKFKNTKLAIAVATALGIHTPYLTAQEAPQAQNETALSEVIVTGSYIRGSAEDAALPVDVVTSEDLAEQGSPSVVQLVKTITASQSAIGESNRYNGGAGTASINLRGFGAGRTLSLLNGRRLADNPIAAFQGGGANLNFIPQAAVGRVELLKDGAAATYGSDAIGGVVNFITRTDLDGLEVDGEYSYIDGSDGDYQGNIAWGNTFDNGNVLLTFGYRHRSRLDIRERDWAIQPYESPSFGGWTGAGNPGRYIANSTPAVTFSDNGCTQLGGVLTNHHIISAADQRLNVPVNPNATSGPTAFSTAGTRCSFQFSNFNDLVNEEHHYQVHAEMNTTLGDGIKSHTEITWARNYVPNQRLSPANLTAQYPTPASLGGTSNSPLAPVGPNLQTRYNVPATHPGLVELRTVCAAPLTQTQCDAMVSGVDMEQLIWRAVAHAGHPTNKDGADHQTIDSKAFRVSTGLSGTAGIFDWDTALTYMQARSSVDTNDLLVNRIQNALNGFGSRAGGPACDMSNPANAGNADAGCYYFNPFTNSVQVSAVNGQLNPYYRAAVANDPKVVEWLYGNYENLSLNEIVVFDGVLSGSTGLELPGGDLAWAFGVQYRYTHENRHYDDFFNYEINPCVDSIDDSTPVCGNPAGPLAFFGANANSNYTRSVYAAFGELSIPLLDSLNASVAARFESYPGNIGTTFDPKVSLRWQALDWLALRGSAGTTFRAPSSDQTDPGCATGVALIGSSYRAVETCGNQDLKPETAESYNIGFILNPGNFTFTADYFLFKFEDELTAESASRMNTTLFPAGQPNRCSDPAYAALVARFEFVGPCGATNINRIRAYTVNGPDTETSGVDVRLQYDWHQVLGGSLKLGAEATYLINFERGTFSLKDNPSLVIANPEDRAGQHDLTAQFFSYPKLRANTFVSFAWNDYTFRMQTRFTEGTEAAFGSPATKYVIDTSQAFGYRIEQLGKTDNYWQHDLVVRWNAPGNMTLTGSVQNILDEDPSDAPSQYNYDYTNGNPLGRVFEIGINKKF